MSKSGAVKDWMLMIYLAGDNNLSEDMAGALDQIAAVRENALQDVAVLAYYDSSYPHVQSRYYDFTPKLTGAARSVSENDCLKIGESDTADPESIVKFVKFCSKKYQARNHALFLSGHSDAFQGMSLFRDEQSKSVMSLSGLRKGLDKITKLLGAKLQILIFDGCVMSCVEVAYEFRDAAEILIGSQGFIPNAGLNYAEMIENWKAKNFGKSPEEAAVKIMTIYLQRQKGLGIGGRSAAISACRLGFKNAADGGGGGRNERRSRPLLELEKKINELSEIFYNNLALKEIFSFPGGLSRNEAVAFLVKKYLIREQLKKILLSSQWNAQTLLFDQMVDIRDFSDQLIAECQKIQLHFDFFGEGDDGSGKPLPEREPANELIQLSEDIIAKCREINIEFDKCVIAPPAARAVGAEYQFARGLSLFFPWSHIGYGVAETEYEKTAFCSLGKEKQWNKFLKMYLREATMRGINDQLWDAVRKISKDKTDEPDSLLSLEALFENLGSIAEKYNPTYDTRGIGNETYQRFFSKFKNLPPFIDNAESIN